MLQVYVNLKSVFHNFLQLNNDGDGGRVTGRGQKDTQFILRLVCFGLLQLLTPDSTVDSSIEGPHRSCTRVNSKTVSVQPGNLLPSKFCCFRATSQKFHSMEGQQQSPAGSSANAKKGRGRPRGSFKVKNKNGERQSDKRNREDTPPEFKVLLAKEPVQKRELPARKVKEIIAQPFQHFVPTKSKPKDNRGRKKRHPSPSPEQNVNSEDDQDNETQPFWDDYLATPLRRSGKTADWDKFLNKGRNITFVAPVTWFKHAPLANIWEKIAVTGLVVEVTNIRIWCPVDKPITWFATIRHYAGYKALIEYENLGIEVEMSKKYKDLSHAWMSFCSNVPKPLGYSRENRILMLPREPVRNKYPYPEFMNMARQKHIDLKVSTVMKNHGEFISSEIEKCQKYKLGDVVEVLDRDNIVNMRLATVTSIVGDRIHVSYVYEEEDDDAGYWFSCHSNYVHEIGFSQTIGVGITGVPPDVFKPLSPDYFPNYPSELILVKGQMLELRHPQLPHLIVGGSVFSVLKYGYFIAEIISNSNEVDFPVRFLFHVTSPYIFPVGFCRVHGIDLIPPYDSCLKGSFNWDKYLLKHGRKPAPLDLLPKHPEHNFKPKVKMEAICIVMPTYLGPATVRRVCGHLIELTFDGWPKNSPSPHEIWTSAFSPNIFPLGYAEMVSHEFRGRVEDP